MFSLKSQRVFFGASFSLFFLLSTLMMKPLLAPSLILGNAATYTITLNSANSPFILSEGYGAGDSQVGSVSFTYEKADDSSTSAYIRLQANGGKLSNTAIITDVATIKVDFIGGSLYVGGSFIYGEIENSAKLSSGVVNFTLPDYPYYVFYTDGSGDVTITSIQITYSCTNPALPPNLNLTEFADHYEVTTYTGTHPKILIPAYYRGKLITKIAAEAFKNNLTLETLMLPDTITHIGDYAFAGCQNLETIMVSTRLESIGDYAFNNCYALTDFEFPDALVTLGTYAFSNCYSLRTAALNEGLIILRQGTFSMCLSIENFSISNTITTIETYAFTSSSSIGELYVPATVITMENDAFRRILNCTIFVAFTSPPSGWAYNWVSYGEYAGIVWGT